MGGLVGGVAAGWIFRERRPDRAGSAPPGRPPKNKPPKGKKPKDQEPPSKSTALLPTAGDRADLYKQLDDMGM